MRCEDVQPRLTAYLDGDLDPDRGTVIRGHLRTCAACRDLAEREAVLRDGLRALPTVDPPAALWSNIQAQLAAAEVEDAKLPAWKRRVRGLRAWLAPQVPRFAIGGVLATAAVGVLWWRTQSAEPELVAEAPTPARVVDTPSPEIRPSMASPLAPVAAQPCKLDGPADADVTEDLAGEAARVTACYATTANELLALAAEARRTWTAAQQAELDARVGELRAAIDAAADGRPRQRAYRALNRYLASALTRDDVALAGVAP